MQNIQIVILAVTITTATAVMADRGDISRLDAFKKGETTKAEVLRELGEPYFRSSKPDGQSVIMYQFSIPDGKEGARKKTVTAGLLFDPQEKLARISYFEQKNQSDH